MKVQIISEGSTKFDYLKKKWGLSILIDGDVLFDTFCNGDWLKTDFDKNNIDVKQIKHIIISHEHWDHTGGLWYILENNEDIKVYICNNFSDLFKEKIKKYNCELVEIKKPTRIKDNIFTTGEIQGTYKNLPIDEQSLIIKQKDKMAVITGCSHPGILKILTQIGMEHTEKIDLLLGGLHLMDKSSKEIAEITTILDLIYNIDTVAPFHCTGAKAIRYFQKIIPQRLQRIKSGNYFTFNTETSSWKLIKRGVKET